MNDGQMLVKGIKIHYIEDGEGDPVMLFHGSRFKAETWKDTGTIAAVSSSGKKAIAVDFPGYGQSEGGTFNSLDVFIEELMGAMKIDRAILMGASMGGNAVIDMAVNNPDMVSGLILVGAVGITSLSERLKVLDGKPSLLIWGAQDRISSPSNYKTYMKYVTNAVFANIGKNHACYLDDPKGFNDKVTEFLKNINRI
ncbi:MAG: alpha/beta fold hydrolase [Thermoplasmata archaeon]